MDRLKGLKEIYPPGTIVFRKNKRFKRRLLVISIIDEKLFLNDLDYASPEEIQSLDELINSID